MIFGSLFAGIGGLDLGFERAGFECRWQVEIDDYAQAVLRKHWPDVPKYRDVRECGAHNLEQVDGIIGGFPCQDLSVAGKGAGINGTRSGFFFELTRIVREVGPRFVVLENVSALLHRGLGDVLGELAESGYNAQWDCIPAAAVGAPHLRDRIFIVATSSRISDPGRDQLREQRQRNGQQHPVAAPPVAGDDGAAGDVADPDRARSQRGVVDPPPVFGEGGGVIERPDWWEVEPGVGRVANGVPRRVDRLRCLGNAVVPQVAEHIAGRVARAIGRDRDATI